MTITTCMVTSAKLQLLEAQHNFSASGGDTFKLALIKASPSGTYDTTSTNYSNITDNSDEVIGTGYTAGGFTLTNVAPVVTGTTAFTSFSPAANWTTATFTTTGCMIYNSSKSNTCVGVYDFGGLQTVTASTFTVIFPVDAAGTALIQIS